MPIRSGYHSRGYLPHLKIEGAAYFVTFRLADSLPREVVIRLKEQREDLLHRAAQKEPAEVESHRKQLFAWHAAEVDSALDQHTGAAWLRDSRIAELVSGALHYFDGERYHLHAWCVMPNHIHAVVRPIGAHALDAILHSWKSFTATEANRTLHRTGQPFWQRESFDHWIRDDVDSAHCCHYTEENPVKAGLCVTAAQWPWSSAARK
jgi:REP element-mobilizing transposase RayT